MNPPEPRAEDGCQPKDQMGNIHHQQGCQQQEEKRVEFLNKKIQILKKSLEKKIFSFSTWFHMLEGSTHSALQV
jgi:hypothetical protein